MLDPARRNGYVDGTEPSTLLGRAVIGSDVLNHAFTAEYENPWNDASVLGCTRYVSTTEVKQVADAFDALTEDQLAEVYEPLQMQGVGYFVEQPFQDILWAVGELRRLYRYAADRGHAVVMEIS